MSTKMQLAPATGTGYFGREDDRRRSAHSFHALFVLSGSKGVSPGVLKTQLRISEGGFEVLLESLQRSYFVDSVSELRGESIVEYYTLTEEGRFALQQMLERMCELPELE